MKAGNCMYGCPGDIPEAIPVFPLPCALLLPRADMPLNIFEPRYIAMVDAAMASHRIIGMVQPDETAPSCNRGPTLRNIGCAGRIISFSETGDGRYRITLAGVARFRIVEELACNTLFRQCRVSAEPYQCDFGPSQCATVDRAAVIRTFRAYLDRHGLEADWETIARTSNETLVNVLSMMAPFAPEEKQALLEAPDLKSRAETLVALAGMALMTPATDTVNNPRVLQ